jgi:DNA-binding response OmpR family regulator
VERDALVLPTRVALVGELADLAAALSFSSDGRYEACTETSSEEAAIVVSPMPVTTLRAFVRSSTVPVLVFDRRGSLRAEEIVALLNAGISTHVSGPSVRVLIAHLDATLRRLEQASA